MTVQEAIEKITEALWLHDEGLEDDDAHLEDVLTFEDAGVLTRDEGLALLYDDGTKIYLTVQVQ